MQPVRVGQSCSWCHHLNYFTGPAPQYCSNCRHRSDLPRMFCDCSQCQQTYQPTSTPDEAKESQE